jgi:hypothetical protein
MPKREIAVKQQCLVQSRLLVLLGAAVQLHLERMLV